MSLFLKRLVSGNKARHKDDELNVELDLAYVTDQIIVMGFPAVGMESIYRNHRADVQRFLSARHGSDFWVFNFCPLRENAYHERVFEGRVSRYPFPDHHVPPFLYLQLVTREIHTWLSGSDARVAVLHCKGKGRSGTLACAYLLSRYASPSTSLPSSLCDSFSDWTLINEREALQTPSPNMSRVLLPIAADRIPAHHAFCADISRVSSESAANTLERVLDLHTSRRMKPSSRHPDVPKRPKMGVSIPSQRRWLFYWSQAVARKGPPPLRPFSAEGQPEDPPDKAIQVTKVKLTELTIRMREPSGIQPHLVQAASVVITGAGKGRAVSGSMTGRLWASLARYSDRLVEELEHWEKGPRGTDGVMESSPFKGEQWDRAKMIRSFAQMGISDVLQPTHQGESRPVSTYVLRPLDGVEESGIETGRKCVQDTLSSESYAAIPPLADTRLPGILLEANREFRIKLFMGEVALGWVWLIPAFHISPDSRSSSLVLSSDNIDFAIGIGKALVDMKISFVRDDNETI